MDKDGLISRAIGLVCPDDETAMEYAKARLRGGPRTSQAQCPRLIAPTPDGSALMILRRYCTALDRMPDGAWAPRGRAPRRNRACRTSFQGSEIEPLGLMQSPALNQRPTVECGHKVHYFVFGRNKFPACGFFVEFHAKELAMDRALPGSIGRMPSLGALFW